MTGKKSTSNNKKEILISGLKKLLSRLRNTSLMDFNLSTRDFTEALALSTLEDVGNDFHQKTIITTVGFLLANYFSTFSILCKFESLLKGINNAPFCLIDQYPTIFKLF